MKTLDTTAARCARSARLPSARGIVTISVSMCVRSRCGDAFAVSVVNASGAALTGAWNCRAAPVRDASRKYRRGEGVIRMTLPTPTDVV